MNFERSSGLGLSIWHFPLDHTRHLSQAILYVLKVDLRHADPRSILFSSCQVSTKLAQPEPSIPAKTAFPLLVGVSPFSGPLGAVASCGS